MNNVWIPMKAYESNGTTYLILAKRYKNGMIRFVRRRITGYFHCSYEKPENLNFDFQFNSLFD